MEISNLSKSFGELKVIDDLSISFCQDKIHCLFGPSGCGKSTLVNIMTGIIEADSGIINGIEKKSFSYVFQEDRLLPWATIEENILFVLQSSYDATKAKEIADKYLSLVKLEDFKNLYPEELSGGMKQRASIARAFAFSGDILIMDEPFKGLHLEIKRELMDYIRTNLVNNKITFFITHDVDEALYLADSIYTFKGPPLTLEKQIDIKLRERLNNPEVIENFKSKILG